MPETIQVGCDGEAKWLWADMMADLREQGGLGKKVNIDPLSMRNHSGAGYYEGHPFYFTWVKDKFFLLTAKEHFRPLVKAFSDVLDYLPFARYRDDNGITLEWDKVDPDARWGVLRALHGQRAMRMNRTWMQETP